nr:hypothetical protein [Tanacetum cinerariifolium]
MLLYSNQEYSIPIQVTQLELHRHFYSLGAGVIKEVVRKPCHEAGHAIVSIADEVRHVDNNVIGLYCNDYDNVEIDACPCLP